MMTQSIKKPTLNKMLLDDCLVINTGTKNINTIEWHNVFLRNIISFWLQGRTDLLCGRGVVLKRHSVVLHVEGL